MNSAALVGHTGFVGGNLARQRPFDACFHSTNIDDICGQQFQLLVVSAMPAAMWIANGNPDADRAILDGLLERLLQVQAEQVVVMSTVAVYPRPVGVDEDSPIDEAAQTPYGRHRLLLEQQLAAHFPQVLAVRLPGLFGPGLKKNAIYDLLHHHETHKLHADSVYQFYDLDWLWRDVSIALAAKLDVCNFATEPTSIREVARAAFGLEFSNDPGSPHARFDMQSRHAALFGGREPYLYKKEQVLTALRRFVEQERQKERA